MPISNSISQPVDLPKVTHQQGTDREHSYEHIARIYRDGPAPLLSAIPGQADRKNLRIAFAIPPFSVGSGGHNIIFQLVLRLEEMGHTCSLWVHDQFGERSQEGPGYVRGQITEHFAQVRAPVFYGFDDWYGADIVVATGWQTVFPVLALRNCRARSYLINDHEPEFYPTSVERLWAADTYKFGLYGIAGSPWLRDLYVGQYGGEGESFSYGVDHDIYFPRPIERDRNTIVFYCRSVTERRAVALGLLALDRITKSRPDTRIVMFGDRKPIDTPFPYEHIGVATPTELSWVFSQATIGICLSLTNYSLIPQEMIACGLPCIDLDRPSAKSIFGDDGPIELVPFDVDELAGAMQRLLDNSSERQKRSEQGIELIRDRTWDAAAVQVETAVRSALRVVE